MTKNYPDSSSCESTCGYTFAVNIQFFQEKVNIIETIIGYDYIPHLFIFILHVMRTYYAWKPPLAYKFQRNKMFLRRSLVIIQYFVAYVTER